MNKIQSITLECWVDNELQKIVINIYNAQGYLNNVPTAVVTRKGVTYTPPKCYRNIY